MIRRRLVDRAPDSYHARTLEDIALLDLVAATVLGLAIVRGLWIGLVREAFSLAGIAAAYLAVRSFSRPLADWLVAASDGGVGPGLAPWLAGLLLVVLTLVAVAAVGRVVRRGVRAVGLGLLDRLGGGLLGAAEGALVIAVVLTLLGRQLGWDHALLANTRTLAAMEQLQLLAWELPVRGE